MSFLGKINNFRQSAGNYYLVGTSETARGITEQLMTNNNFKQWLIGFTEGIDTWYVRKNKTIGFEISLHSENASLLYKIKSFLGFGAVSHNSKQALTRYYLTKGQHLKLIKFFNNHIKSDYKFFQFYNWCTYIHQYIDPTVPLDKINKDHTKISLDNAWLSGFIEAGGYFRIAISENRPKLIFEITFNQIEPLKEIAEQLSLKNNIRLDKGDYILYTSDYYARNKLIKYIEQFPLYTKKRISYLNWKKAHELEKTDPKYMDKILEFKDKITNNVKNV